MTKRDLHADLAICNAATAGPWALDYDWEERRYCVEAVDVPSWGGGVIVADCGQDADARFIAEARTGWPHAIERALEAERKLAEAEAKVERLRTIIRHMESCVDYDKSPLGAYLWREVMGVVTDDART